MGLDLPRGRGALPQICGTPPEHLLFALRAALDLIFAEGLENVFHRHRLLAEATRRAVGTWAEGQSIGFNVSEPEERSDTVTAIVTRNGESAQPLVDYCREKCGVVLGRALGQSEGKGFRIAHMGHVNAPMIFGTLSVVEMALGALGLPHGKGGVQAAVEFLAKSVPALYHSTKPVSRPAVLIPPDFRSIALAARHRARAARRLFGHRHAAAFRTATHLTLDHPLARGRRRLADAHADARDFDRDLRIRSTSGRTP